MSDAATTPPAIGTARARRLPLLLGLVAAVALGAGAFYAVQQGLVPIPAFSGQPPKDEAKPLPDIEFVPLEPLVISLGPGARSRHLRFAAQLEVAGKHAAEVARLQPRILDMLNGYLRVVEPAELEDPSTLIRLRAQMLRRVQIVTGEGRVRDLLITEFVLN